MSREAKWIWKAETPCGVPAGAPDLGGEVRQRGEVVADDGGRVGEATARELHTVSRVARKADDYRSFFSTVFGLIHPASQHGKPA